MLNMTETPHSQVMRRRLYSSFSSHFEKGPKVRYNKNSNKLDPLKLVSVYKSEYKVPTTKKTNSNSQLNNVLFNKLIKAENPKKLRFRGGVDKDVLPSLEEMKEEEIKRASQAQVDRKEEPA